MSLLSVICCFAICDISRINCNLLSLLKCFTILVFENATNTKYFLSDLISRLSVNRGRSYEHLFEDSSGDVEQLRVLALVDFIQSYMVTYQTTQLQTTLSTHMLNNIRKYQNILALFSFNRTDVISFNFCKYFTTW